MTVGMLRTTGRERNCDKHTIKQVVHYTDKASLSRRADLVAAMMRLYAQYADGECTEKGAEDAQITRPTGLVLHFSSEDKRLEFRWYVEEFTRKEIRERLRFTP